MFSRNLRFYRLKSGMTKAELANRSGLTPMAITNYENGTRKPGMEIVKRLASVLNVSVSDFLTVWNENLVFDHGEFRKTASLPQTRQEYIRQSVEEYFCRFFTTLELLGGQVLPQAPECHVLPLTGNIEDDAISLRKHLDLVQAGPLANLTAIIENRGILVYQCNADCRFSGMNGFVNARPYIVVNSNMSPERIRTAMVHELAHLMFQWKDDMDSKAVEEMATAISGAFLFPRQDAFRELGVCRKHISGDMALVCQEYGISMFLLTKRSQVLGIVSKEVARSFFMEASSKGWRTLEPSRIEPERAELLEQLVLRLIGEDEISIQKGAELLGTSYEYVASKCNIDGR